MPTYSLIALSEAQWVAIAFAGAIIAVAATAGVMTFLQRLRREKAIKDLVKVG